LTLGRDVEPARARISLVLAGHVAVFARDQVFELEPGEAVIAAPLSDLCIADVRSSTGFELDWEAGTQGPFAVKLRLAAGLLETAHAVAENLRLGDVALLATSARKLFERLAAEGFTSPDTAALDSIDGPSQIGISAIDAVLNDLRVKPQLQDLEARLGCSRWTLQRSFHRLNRTYGLRGLAGATDWRAMRAFARLRVGGLLMSHPRAKTREVADYLGYRSPDAMCHAFANAGLPSPGQLRALRLRSL
jgi:AraC-like DNA-binding protein